MYLQKICDESANDTFYMVSSKVSITYVTFCQQPNRVLHFDKPSLLCLTINLRVSRSFIQQWVIQIALLLRSIKILDWKRQHLRMLQYIKTINVLKWCVKHTRFVMGQQHFVKIKFNFEYNQQETCPIDQPGNKDRHKPPHWRSSYPIKIIGIVVV